MLAAVTRGDQDGGQDRPGEREPGADQERPVKALGQRDRRVMDSAEQHVLGLSVGDRGEDRQTERSADLLRGVDQP
jgi:hypothetical protein